jgi:hypothetical protein
MPPSTTLFGNARGSFIWKKGIAYGTGLWIIFIATFILQSSIKREERKGKNTKYKNQWL